MFICSRAGAKDPLYSDIKYVSALIAPQTVNTLPLETLEAFRVHGEPVLSIDQAIEAPRIHALGKTLHLENRIGEGIRIELQKKGHKIKIRADFDNYFGGAQGIQLDSTGSVLSGGADSRRDGFVVGY